MSNKWIGESNQGDSGFPGTEFTKKFAGVHIATNTKQLKAVLESLRSKLTDPIAPTDAEFHEMAFATRDVDSQMMFDYFEGKLEDGDVQIIENHASRFRLFLESLVGIGELVQDS